MLDLENSGWKALPSGYHLFRSMQNTLAVIRFTSEQGAKHGLNSLLYRSPFQMESTNWQKMHFRSAKPLALLETWFEKTKT